MFKKYYGKRFKYFLTTNFALYRYFIFLYLLIYTKKKFV